MITRILVPLDGSKLAEMVLPPVEDLAKRLGAEVCFVQAVEMKPMFVAEGGRAIKIPEEEFVRDKQEALEYLTELTERWRTQGLNAQLEVLEGAPARTIVEFARSHEFHMIAMSTHGRTGLSRMVYGSVADHVLRDAGMPVFLVRSHPKAMEKAA